MNGGEHIQCSVNDSIRSFKELVIESVVCNSKHGKPLQTNDKVRIISLLEEFKLSPPEISHLINIPITKFEKFKYSRITNTVTGETVILKPTTKHFHSEIVGDDFEFKQGPLALRSQVVAINQVVQLIESGFIDLKTERIKNRLCHLFQILQKIFA